LPDGKEWVGKTVVWSPPKRTPQVGKVTDMAASGKHIACHVQFDGEWPVLCYVDHLTIKEN